MHVREDPAVLPRRTNAFFAFGSIALPCHCCCLQEQERLLLLEGFQAVVFHEIRFVVDAAPSHF